MRLKVDEFYEERLTAFEGRHSFDAVPQASLNRIQGATTLQTTGYLIWWLLYTQLLSARIHSYLSHDKRGVTLGLKKLISPEI